MKTCSNCGQPIQENDMKSAAEILGELQETSTGEFDDTCLCQFCKQGLGSRLDPRSQPAPFHPQHGWRSMILK